MQQYNRKIVLVGQPLCKRYQVVPKGLNLLEMETITKKGSTIRNNRMYELNNVQINILYTNGKANKSPVVSHTQDQQTKQPNK